GWERARDVRREAAPLMAADAGYLERLARLEPAGDGDAPAPEGDDDTLTVEAVPSLLGRGSMLRGADDLLATARRPAAWAHPDDARRTGVADGDTVVLVGAGGSITLPLRVTDDVAPGCVR